MGNFRFQKEERLHKRQIIQDLFAKGSSRLIFPVKVLFLRHPDPRQSFHQVLITVPARNFKKAVDRNTLKRRIREGYRLNKSMAPSSPAFCLAYIYIAKEILSSPEIHKAIQSSLTVLKSDEKKS